MYVANANMPTRAATYPSAPMARMTVSDGMIIRVNANTWRIGTACERVVTSAAPRAVVAFPVFARDRGSQRNTGAHRERRVDHGVERRAGAGRRQSTKLPDRRGRSPAGSAVGIHRGRLGLAAVGSPEYLEQIARAVRHRDHDRRAIDDLDLIGGEVTVDPEVV